MSPAPLATIVIDNYNYARFLRDAIDSALGQTYNPVETIVVDDGSTDESRDVIASYGDRITSLLKENGGQGSAFNAGFRASHGDVVIFLDADDMLVPSALELAMPLFANPDVVKVHWPLLITEENGRPTHRLYPGDKLAEGDLREFVCQAGPTNLLSAPGCGNAWSRWLLDQLFPVPEKLYTNGVDTYLFEAAPFFGQLRVIKEPQTLYRQHRSSDHTSHTAEEKVAREIRFYDHYADVVASRCRDAGAEPDADRWKKNSWWHRQQLAFLDIASLPSPDIPIVVADEGTWEAGAIHGRQRIPFPESDGEYAGLPPDDKNAIGALEHACANGAGFFVVGWPAFWWLDHFPLLRDYLRRYPETVSNERVIIYDLRFTPTR